MKKIFVSPLLVALTSHTFASGYACKEVFKSKLEKVELKRGIRKAAIVDATVVAGLGGASVFIATSGLLAAPFAVIVLGGINGASIAVPTNFVANSLDRSPGLLIVISNNKDSYRAILECC